MRQARPGIYQLKIATSFSNDPSGMTPHPPLTVARRRARPAGLWWATETLGGLITPSPEQGQPGRTPTSPPRHAAYPGGPGRLTDNRPPRKCSPPRGGLSFLVMSGDQRWTLVTTTAPLLGEGRPIEGGTHDCRLAPQHAPVRDVPNLPGTANQGLFAVRRVTMPFSHRIAMTLGGPPDRHHTPRPAPVGDVHGLHMMDDQGLFAAGRAVTPHSHLTTLPPVNATRLASSRGAQGTRGMELLASTAPAPVNGGADARLTTVTPVNATRLASSRGAQRTRGMEPLASTAPAPVNGGRGANNRTNTRRSTLRVRSPSAPAHPGTASTENFAPSLAWTDPGPVHEGSNTPSTTRSVPPSGWHRDTGRRARNNHYRPLARKLHVRRCCPNTRRQIYTNLSSNDDYPRRPLVRTALLGTPNCPCSQHRDSRKASLG